MNTRRLVIIAVTLTLIVIAALNMRTAVVSSGNDLSDYPLRHPDATVVVESAPDLSDYALRHAEEIRQSVQPDLSDWYLRHRDQSSW